jgi:spore germination protein KB
MTKSISAKQLMYSAALFVIASNQLTKSLYPYSKNQTWIAVAIAAAAGSVIVSSYGILVKNHTRKSLFEINETVFGMAGGKIISAAYLFFFLTLTIFNTRDLGSFVHNIVLPTTPLNLIYAAFLAICVYAVRKGAVKMTLYTTLSLFIYLVLVVFIAALLIPNIRTENFLPVFTLPLSKVLLSTYFVTMLPYTEILVFLMLVKNIDKPEATGKALRRGMFIGAATILLLVCRDIAVLGGYVQYTSNPTFNTIRLINVGDILTRLEIINAVFHITLLFFKVSILMYAVTTGIGQLFCIKESQIFTLIVGLLTVVCANFFFTSSGEHQQWFKAAAVYATLFVFILPLLTLIVSGFRKKADAAGPEETQRQQ